ncbi:hypothetical protein PYW08_012930 [Mythimna loreyi]|uniref:Uncharacterized protein n=1 Tax=Mythimna loreyi TaxID=667449 RepID=A0ACC2Q1N2_9NEOP|nr:hypothetical protein PYW08_012930 [Mythimna loreyi]
MTNVLKCDKCNIVIDEMLSYIQNKVSIVDEETLVRICVSSFTSDEIKQSKSLLFDAIPSNLRKIIRKNKGKEGRDLTDIINLFKSAEPDDIPVFVAHRLEKLPPITFDHLDCTKLLKDLVRMQAAMDEIKNTYATLENLKDLRTELFQIRNDSLPPTSAFKVNAKRGAWLMDSGPMGLSHLHNPSIDGCGNIDENSSSDPNLRTPQFRNIRQVHQKQILSESCSRLQRSSFVASASAAVTHARATSVANECATALASAAVTSSPPVPTGRSRQLIATGVAVAENDGAMAQRVACNIHNKEDGWQRVTYRKKRPKYRYIGRTGVATDVECQFKAADKKVPVFITNIHSETTEDEIVRYIHSKTQEMVSLEKIIMKKERDHVAYKFFVSESKLPSYLDENLWPRGIIFRRFVNYKRRNSSGLITAGGLNKNSNG